MWRTPTRQNVVTLVLLYFATANGDLTSSEAQYYLSAACQHLRSLYKSVDPSSSPLAGGSDWLPISSALHDALRSIEARTPCFMRVVSPCTLLRLTARCELSLTTDLDTLSIEVIGTWRFSRQWTNRLTSHPQVSPCAIPLESSSITVRTS